MKKRFASVEIIFIILLIITMIFVLYAVLVRPFINEKPKYEVEVQEKSTLILMTKAFLNQNNYIYSFSKISNDCLLSNTAGRYQIAAKYYYLLNHEISLDDNAQLYDEILTLAQKIFNNKNISFENFTINTDECGMTKYSSLEGNIVNEGCDTEDTIYEIGDVYKQEDYYIVEFFAAKAIQTKIKNDMCQDLEKSMSYNLKLSKFDGKSYYDVNYNSCCKVDEICNLSGVFSLKEEIINQAKTNDKTYKIKYEKKGENFIYYALEK